MTNLAGALDHSAPRNFDEKAFRRQNLADWDRKWHGLSSLGRSFVLTQVRLPMKAGTIHRVEPGYIRSLFSLGTLIEVKDAGFIDLLPAQANGPHDRFVVSGLVVDFVARAQSLRRYHLLADNQPSELAGYVNHVYFVDQFVDVLSGILRAAGVVGPFKLGDLLNRYVVDHQWPAWVAASLNESLADRILQVVGDANGPISSARLVEEVAASDPDRAHMVINELVARLALVEGIQTSSWELMVGFLPAVRKKKILAAMPRDRPPLLEAKKLRALGPEGSPVVNDIRAVLLEVASQPPRLRQDQALFHKEIARFQTSLDPLPDWLLNAMKWSDEGRLNRAIAWACVLKLARVSLEANPIRLHLDREGEEWLSAGAPEDSLKIFDFLRSFELRDALYSPHLGLFVPGLHPGELSGPCDMFYLGTHIAALQSENGRLPRRHWRADVTDHLALRGRLDASMTSLRVGVFYRLDSVESHLVFDGAQPIEPGVIAPMPTITRPSWAFSSPEPS